MPKSLLYLKLVRFPGMTTSLGLGMDDVVTDSEGTASAGWQRTGTGFWSECEGQWKPLLASFRAKSILQSRLKGVVLYSCTNSRDTGPLTQIRDAAFHGGVCRVGTRTEPKCSQPSHSMVFRRLSKTSIWSCYPTYFIVSQFLHFRMKPPCRGLACKPHLSQLLSIFAQLYLYHYCLFLCPCWKHLCRFTPFLLRESCPSLLTRFPLNPHVLGKDLLGTSLTHTRDWSFLPLFRVGGSHLNYNTYLIFSCHFLFFFLLTRASHELQDP